jgi:hypothetical protein
VSSERCDTLEERLHDLQLEVVHLQKRCEALEAGAAIERRRQSKVGRMWDNAFGGFNQERDEILHRLGRVELVLNQLQAHKELIG